MITGMYDCKDFRKSKGKENKQQYMYVGLQLKDSATKMAEKQWNVICRPAWMTSPNNDQFVIRGLTVFNVDDEKFEVIFGVDMNTNRVRLIVDGKLYPDLGALGIMLMDRCDQTFINSTAHIVDHMQFCKGIPIKLTTEIKSVVPVSRKWAELQLDGTLKTWNAVHSHHCNIILSFI